MNEIPVQQPILYHYTCRHHAEQILMDGGRLVPAARLHPPHILRGLQGVARWSAQMIWLTARADPLPANRGSFGAIDCVAGCERNETKFRVLDDQDVYPWSVLRSTWPGPIVNDLEVQAGAAGEDTDDWWCSGGEVWVHPMLRLAVVSSS